MKQGFQRFSILAVICTMLGSGPLYSQELELQSLNNPVITEMTIEAKRDLRKVKLEQLLEKYKQNGTFVAIHQYMITNRHAKGDDTPPSEPDQLIVATLDKTSTFFEKTKSMVGKKFKRQYAPATIEANINKYLWLRGLCFFILGIGDEHRLALSYFYQPDHEQIKDAFMVDTVKYSYPEVRDIPENAAWFEAMGEVMERIGYRAFNIEKYLIEASPGENASISSF